MNNQTNYKHWNLEQDADGILWLYFDRKDASVNSLNQEVLEEFSTIIDNIAANPTRGVIIASSKKTGFIAGADIDQFSHFISVEEATSLIRRGQIIFDKLAALKLPTLAMIEGFCLGGGFELALACRYRIAEDGPKTKLGLPEVKLGIHPGWGGTIRLPRLVGALKAMDVILTGKMFDARTAAKIGMIDAAVPKRQLVRAARKIILEKPEPHTATRLEALTNNGLLRPLLGKILLHKLRKKVNELHYPAPYIVVENWMHEGVESDQAWLVEANSIGHLFLSETSRNLVRVFHLQDRLKGLAKGVKFDVDRVHVIGAGTMGGDIAAWCALRGLNVTLQDRGPQYIGPAIKRAYALFKKRLKEPRLIQQAMDRLLPDVQGLGIAQADVIIEAIFENLQAKQELFKMIEAKAKPSAILASNTSSIPLDEINTVMKNPERLIGIHFFNPVASMDLVEVVQGDKTLPAIVKQTLAFVRKIDRSPLPVKSKPGFLVNRVLMPYLMEAVTLLGEGVPASVIDKAATDFGMAMGPIELADLVGIDVCLYVAETLMQYYGGTIPDSLRSKVKAGELGRKSKKGFYEYDKAGQPIKKAPPKDYVVSKDISARLVLRMINEAAACLREGVIADSDLLDAGMIFGTGFAPFRGGPMQYSKAEGIEQFRQKLQAFQQQYGDRFKMDEAWQKESTFS